MKEQMSGKWMEPEQDEGQPDQSPQSKAKDRGYTNLQQDPQHLLLSQKADQSERPLQSPGNAEDHNFQQGQQMLIQDIDQSRQPSQTSTKNADGEFSQQVEQKPMLTLKPRTITGANAGDDYFQGSEDESNGMAVSHPESFLSQQADALSTQMKSYLQSRIPYHQLGPSMHINELPSSEFNSQLQGPLQSGRPSSPDASHMQICQAILYHGQSSNTIMEDESICLDEYGTTNALAQIFLSTFLTRQAQSQGINLYYQHNCGRHRPNSSLIQELLPSPLLFNDDLFQPMGRENLESFCQAVSKNGGLQGLSPIDIMLWNANTSRQRRSLKIIVRGRPWKKRRLQNQRPVSMMELYVPIIHENLVKASRRAREVEGALVAGYGVLKLTPDVVGQPVARGRAVIVLSCMDIDCQDHSIVPYFNYLVLIPPSIQVVDLVITKKCEDNQLCKEYAYGFASNIRQFSPGAKVELIVANPSAADSFARLIEAEHVICGPGWGLPCIFPALSRSAEHGRVTLLEGESQEQRYILSMLRFPFVHPVHAPRGRLLAERLGAFENNPTEMTRIAQISPLPSTGSCRFLRGKVGHWVQDMEYAARSAQYRTPLRHYSGNAENLFQKNVKNGKYGDLRFRPPTTYRWEESRYEKCQPSFMTRENVCDVLPSMGIQRIFILGDSLNLQMAQSIWMMLTTEEAGDSPTPRGTLEPNFEAMITCPSGYQIKVVFVRNDELLENDLPVSVDGENQNCHTYCYPWTQKYLYDEVKTVFFVNAGAHIHSFDLFTAMIDRFVHVFDGLNRPDDLVLFRTLVPGHWDCSRPGLAPFKTFDEYMKDSAAHESPQTEAVYGWDKFSPYNDYAVNVIDRRRFQTSDTPKALMEVVDIYPTTILRPDGHCSDEFRLPAYSTTDCLHYTLPGPIDWWNHLAFSHLVDIGRQQSTHNEELKSQDAQGFQRQPEQQQNQHRQDAQGFQRQPEQQQNQHWRQNVQQEDGQAQGQRDDYQGERQVVKQQNLNYSQRGQQDEDTQQQYSNHIPSGLEQGGDRQDSNHQQGYQQEGPQTQQRSYQKEPNDQQGYQKQSDMQQHQDYHARGYQQHEGTQKQSQSYPSKQVGESARQDYEHQGVQQQGARHEVGKQQEAGQEQNANDQSGYHQQGHIQTGQNYQQGNQQENVQQQNQQGYQQAGGLVQSQSYQQQGGQ
jgi:GDSL/SGNH-like Acyl-Esterase family found in Pmr5 and Cas1p